MWLALSLALNVLLLVALRSWFKKRWLKLLRPVKVEAVDAGSLDPILAQGPLGPLPESLILEFAAIGVHGGIRDVETWVLCNLAKKAGKMFEFGTCTGKTTWLMALNAPQAEITTLTLRPEDISATSYSKDDHPTVIKWAEEDSKFTHFYYQGTPEEARITQLYGDSKQFDEKPYLKSFDLIFVDGSHARSYVESDSQKALAMVKPGGIVLWHDYPHGGPLGGVAAALNKLAETVPLKHIRGTTLVAYKA